MLEQLREDALLGMDVSLWPHLVEAMELNEVVQLRKLAEAKENSYAVTTRAQTEKLETQRSQSNEGWTEPQFR